MLSRLRLPRISPAPASILEYLVERFPHVPAVEWLARVRDGKVMLEDGSPVDEAMPYRAEALVLYSREVAAERSLGGEEAILYRDENILVADKPHGIPVVPAGDVVNEALLRRLINTTGIHCLSPLHRLDRETAGLVMFAIRPEIRGIYQRLFADKAIDRRYMAVAPAGEATVGQQWKLRYRLEAGEPWFRMKIVEGEPNSETIIELLDVKNGRGLFALNPTTGKKHQLRIHMVSIGHAIENDLFYPELIREVLPPVPPLQLLATGLAFMDPISGEPMNFRSEKHLTF